MKVLSTIYKWILCKPQTSLFSEEIKIQIIAGPDVLAQLPFSRRQTREVEYTHQIIGRTPDDHFWRRFVTVDKTWGHTRVQTGSGERASKKAKAVFTAGKVIAISFGIPKDNSN
ncbi:hypothetical protein LAZ67_15000072 [Cordylochernes scorpioides]|uniref:Uncharacterized protein n=1 Tax=Cordylochernes scorpioides TaxID=51811 RepID=A0ABY6L7R5_9ARAC|nr:hypothetical protein LAZ67_15000072 [Cordylochernes scorpioides]